MKIILLKSYENLGKVGEIVKVKPGFARNYLIPNKIASLATDQNIKALEVFLKSQENKEAKNRINLEALSSNWNRERIIKEISLEGYPAYEGSCSEIYLEKSFINRNLNPPNRLPNAKLLGETSLMFLIHPTITEKNMNMYANKICEVLKKAMR